MLDLKWLRRHPERLDENLKRRGSMFSLDTFWKVEAEYRRVKGEVQLIRSQRRQSAKASIPREQEVNSELRITGARLRESLDSLEKKASELEKTLRSYMLQIPNMLDGEAPEGLTEEDAVILRYEGKVPSYSVTALSHDILAKNQGWLDIPAASAMSGARFSILKGPLATLERALSFYMMDFHLQRGYTEVATPYLVHEEAVCGVGQLPKFSDDLFRTTENYWLISTGEVPLSNLHRQQSLDVAQLPLRYVACTPCFRSEAGAAGRDTRGLLRQHQFNKVELVHFCSPDQGKDEHRFLVGEVEALLQSLKLPYLVKVLCGGDTGFSSSLTYDIEVWLPSQEKYREISSCSLCSDFQTRRMETKMRLSSGESLFPYTLNGSGLPLGRTLAAILENNQNPDGSITIPECLRPYMGGKTCIGVGY